MDAGANASVLPVAERGEPRRLRRGGRGDCRLSRWCATGCSASRAARWSRSPSRPMCSRLSPARLRAGSPSRWMRSGRPICACRGNGIDPALLHRVAVIGAGTLDSLPHNGAVVTLLAVCGSTHRESYFDIVMAGIVGALIALAAVIALGSVRFVLSPSAGGRDGSTAFRQQDKRSDSSKCPLAQRGRNKENRKRSTCTAIGEGCSN